MDAQNIEHKSLVGNHPYTSTFFCLNLARRPDRRIRAWDQFRREGLEVTRLLAPDAMGCTEPRAYRNEGARACGLAHRLAWRQARKTNTELVLVFEDDVVLCDAFADRLQAVWELLPNDWMILYFGCVFHTPPDMIAPGLLRVTGRTWDMHGYAIRKPLCDLVSRELSGLSCKSRVMGSESGPSLAERPEWWWRLDPKDRGRRRWDTACDVVLADYHKQVPAYAVWPPMAWQICGLSNNENAIRGNYLQDGTQKWLRDAILHLPAVAYQEVVD